MSQRAIKRYEEALREKQRSLAGATEEDDESDEEEIGSQVPRATNPFDILGDAQDNEDGSEKSEDANAWEDCVGLKQSHKESERSDQPVPGSEREDGKGNTRGNETITGARALIKQKGASLRKKSKKKRARQRKKSRQRLAQHADDIPEEFFCPDDPPDFRERVADLLLELENLAFGSSVSEEASKENLNPESGSQEAAEYQDLVFKICAPQAKHLNPDSELKRLFGSRIVEKERRAEDAEAARLQQRSRQRVRGRGSRRLRRRLLLVTPRDTWEDRAPGLSLVLDESVELDEDTPPDLRYFRYRWEPPYSAIQQEYRVRVATHDPNLLAELVSKYPFHVDSLLQLSELYRQMGELDKSAEMVERALYVLESACPALFNPESGMCRLLYDYPENRSLYVALLRHSQLLTRRGLHRTSLEVLKLLLCMDPHQDPMGVLLMIDSIAIAAKEGKWLETFYEVFFAAPLQYFPNFALSVSLCKLIGGDEMEGSTGSEAENTLVKALLAFPMALRPLVLAIDETDMQWTQYTLYDDDLAMQGIDDGGALYRMCRVYAERSKHIWKAGQNKALLRTCSLRAGEIALAGGKEALEAVKLRKEASAWIRESRLYREVNISDYIDGTTELPAEVLAGDDGDAIVGPRDPRIVGPVEATREFFRSMMPSREAEDASAEQDGDYNVNRLLQSLYDIFARNEEPNDHQEPADDGQEPQGQP